jgi:hypothetical protein
MSLIGRDTLTIVLVPGAEVEALLAGREAGRQLARDIEVLTRLLATSVGIPREFFNSVLGEPYSAATYRALAPRIGRMSGGRR